MLPIHHCSTLHPQHELPKKHQGWIAVYDQTYKGSVRAITLINKRTAEALPFVKVGSLTNENMVTISMEDVLLTNIYNRVTEPKTPLEEWMEMMNTRETAMRHIIAGDFNLHDELWERSDKTSPEARRWKQWSLNRGLRLASTPYEPTYRSEREESTSVIDLIFASDAVGIEVLGKPVRFGSDHAMINWTIQLDTALHIETKTTGFNYKGIDWEKFDEVLEEKSDELHLTAKKYLTTKSAVDTSIRAITTLLVECLESTTTRLNIVNRSKRWWKPELTEMRKETEKAHRRARNTPQEAERANAMQKTLEDAIDAAKSECWNDFLSTRNPHNIWEVLRYTKSKHANGITPELKTKDGNTASSFPQITDAFFRELFPEAPCSEKQRMRVQADKRWPELKKAEIEKAINEQSSNKAPGPDSIKTVILKRAWTCKTFRNLITKPFRACIRLGYHPKAFREGLIVIIRKPGKHENLPRSYRPITLVRCSYYFFFHVVIFSDLTAFMCWI